MSNLDGTKDLNKANTHPPLFTTTGITTEEKKATKNHTLHSTERTHNHIKYQHRIVGLLEQSSLLLYLPLSMTKTYNLPHQLPNNTFTHSTHVFGISLCTSCDTTHRE